MNKSINTDQNLEKSAREECTIAHNRIAAGPLNWCYFKLMKLQ